MSDSPLRLYYDFTDPLSHLLALELRTVLDGRSREIVWHGYELRPPPEPLVGVDDEVLAPRWAEAHRVAATMECTFAPPFLVPWTRKAHELVRHGSEEGVEDELRTTVFQAYLFEGLDIGRVDVLVELAVASGLDRTGTKAVLDVDRYEGEVAAARREAWESGIRTTPTLEWNGDRLEGFHNRRALGTFLRI